MRFLDLLISVIALIGLSPLFLLVAVAQKWTSPGPVFYRPLRVGRFRKPFRLYKFRTMVPAGPASGPAVTGADDARVTRLGRVLRLTKIDELPQVINVVLGEMSLVGPRPEDPKFVAGYSPRQARLLDLRPGITSRASIRFRHEERLLRGRDPETVYRQEILPVKLDLELDYLERRSFWSDCSVLVQTFLCLWRRPDGSPLLDRWKGGEV